MNEQDIDLTEKCTVKFKPEMVDTYDIIVCIAQEPFVPDVIKKCPKTIFWTVEDADFVTRDIAEDRYRKIKTLVQKLITDNKLSHPQQSSTSS
jgi:protein-tyrosine-phosphatase